MVKRNANNNTIGYVAFLLGVFISIIAGLFYAAGLITPEVQGYVAIALVILGLVVGLLNLLDKDASAFLIAVLALAIVGLGGNGISDIPYVGTPFILIVSYIAMFVFPAAVVVALKVIWDMAKI
jgi:hypothetical protein